MIKYDLFESFAFNLSRTSAAATAALYRRLAPFDITPVQWGILSGLKGKDGITPSELMGELERDLPSTIRVIWKLEEKGYVCRECNPSDRRSYIVRLTPEGHSLWERLVPVVLQLNSEVYGAIDPDYLKQMTQTVQCLQETYNTLLRE
ncbi:MarR family winged helix-turn-helix transcriptional regulator [Holophaga foetida]|uniref:MarR family winged helix-turn-helix transcriptional regulator n=1 Tax=Holophaga foetida TaxID=35839 RepID=UPI0002471CE6|nr:MarR family transcriptional regulator [Holophaga foetida]